MLYLSIYNINYYSFDIRDLNMMKKLRLFLSKLEPEMLFFHLFLIIILFLLFVYLANYKLCVFLLITCLILLPSIKSINEFYYLIFIDGLLIILPFFLM